MRKRNISPEYVMHESVSFDLLLSIPTQCNMLIRASVDALCRDGASEISRDPHTKRLTRRESLARP